MTIVHDDTTGPNIRERLTIIQHSLKAPKDHRSPMGYQYRSCEDILEAAKPLLYEQGVTLVLSDAIEMIGTRFYVKATATLSIGTESVSATAYAREEESRKGTDDAKITGAASSYARKYALNGLFCIDDTKDADSDGEKKSEPVRKAAPPRPEAPKPQAEPKKPSTPAQQGEIQDLVKELGMDLQKDILDKMRWTWPLTADQAAATIEKLKTKLNKILDDAAKAA
jgi:hypothetical protein